MSMFIRYLIIKHFGKLQRIALQKRQLKIKNLILRKMINQKINFAENDKIISEESELVEIFWKHFENTYFSF